MDDEPARSGLLEVACEITSQRAGLCVIQLFPEFMGRRLYFMSSMITVRVYVHARGRGLIWADEPLESCVYSLIGM